MTAIDVMSSTDTAPDTTTDTAAEQRWIAPGEHGFLVGETLYLRPPEEGDAAYAHAWHASPFPIIRQRAEKLIKEELPKQADQRQVTFIACRRGDDIPVGSIFYDGRLRHGAFVKVFANPPVGESAAAVKSEMLRILVPWLSTEMKKMIVWAELDAPEPDVIAGAEAAGMRPAGRLREMIWRDGARHDRWLYELPHPRWLERLGDPGPSIEQEREPAAAVPTSRRVSIPHPDGPVPENALLVSERVALRLTEPEDTKQISRLLRQETDAEWDGGRWLASSHQLTRWLEESQEQTPPQAMFLAVILRETGQVIGGVELFDIDLFHRTAETGSIIYQPEFRSQGYGSEAKNLLLEYVFDHLGLHMVTSNVWSFNPRSRAALHKQGYRDAGLFQWARQTDEGFVSMWLLDLLASEWRERVNAPA